MIFAREWAMPSADTFSCQPIGDFARKYITGTSVDPFARNSLLCQITNDLNPDTSAQSHIDGVQFLADLAGMGVVADSVVLDPPYSSRQIAECYAGIGRAVTMKDTQNAVMYNGMRREAMRICVPGTVVLSFGWNSCGMGKHFEMLEILLVAHGGAHNDTICLAERMVTKQDDLFA